jgi:phosphoribosyl-ATP pyrophosphohydrolase
MAQALHSIDAYPDRTVEIVVHITETLGEQRREDLVAALEENSGITTAEFCPLRYHLMLVRYDRDMYSSQDVLARVASQNVDARLIGPV